MNSSSSSASSLTTEMAGGDGMAATHHSPVVVRATAELRGGTNNNNEVARNLELIHQRQQAQLQELQTKRSFITKNVNIIQQYALVWERCDEKNRLGIEERIRKLIPPIFDAVRVVFNFVRSGVKSLDRTDSSSSSSTTTTEEEETKTKTKGEGEEEEGEEVVMDNTERATLEARKLLDRLREAVRPTSLFQEIDLQTIELQTELIDESVKQANVLRMTGGYRGAHGGRGGYRGGPRGGRGGFRGGFRGGKNFRPRPDTSKFELDLRPNVIILQDLDGASESDVREGMKEYVGVRGVTISNGEASIIFEKHWQTSRPINCGVTVNGRVGNDYEMIILNVGIIMNRF